MTHQLTSTGLGHCDCNACFESLHARAEKEQRIDAIRSIWQCSRTWTTAQEGLAADLAVRMVEQPDSHMAPVWEWGISYLMALGTGKVVEQPWVLEAEFLEAQRRQDEHQKELEKRPRPRPPAHPKSARRLDFDNL